MFHHSQPLAESVNYSSCRNISPYKRDLTSETPSFPNYSGPLISHRSQQPNLFNESFVLALMNLHISKKDWPFNL